MTASLPYASLKGVSPVGVLTVSMPYLFARECLYSVHGTVIISITVPIVKESITAMEVTLFGPVFHKD